MPVRLSVRNNIDGSEGTIDFEKEVIMLGRSEAVDLALPDMSVSEEHAQILLHEGQWIVLDVGSDAGTLFNGYPLDAQQPVLINAGDVLTLGCFDVQFDLVEAAPPVRQSAPPPAARQPEPSVVETAGYKPPRVDRFSGGVDFAEPEVSDKTEIVQNAFLSKVLGAFGVEEEAPYLTVLNGNNAGLVIQLKDLNTDIVLGRSRRASYVIEDECISREHAKLRRDLNGVVLSDLGSRNGVLINGNQLSPHQPNKISHGDEVRLGTTRLKFTDPSAAAMNPGTRSLVKTGEEGTVIRATESMEVAEVEALLEQARVAQSAQAAAAAAAAAPAYRQPEPPPQPAYQPPPPPPPVQEELVEEEEYQQAEEEPVVEEFEEEVQDAEEQHQQPEYEEEQEEQEEQEEFEEEELEHFEEEEEEEEEDEEEEEEVAEPAGRGAGFWVLVAGGVLFLVGGIGALVYFLFLSKPS